MEEIKKEIFEQYASIKNQIKVLKEQEDELNKQVLAEMEANGIVKANSDFGTFSVVSRKTYKFSGEAEKLIQKYKECINGVEITAKEKGMAEEQISNSLRFQNVKN